MAAPIDFYFDFSSPYGYFASQQIDAIAGKYGREVTWRPILLGAVFKVTGAQPLPSLPLKGEYSRRDILRCARLLDLPYQWPAKFPIPTQAPARAVYWAQKTDTQKAKTLAQTLYRAYFGHNQDISSPEVTAQVAAGIGYDGAAVAAAINDPAIKDKLKAEVDDAIAKGVFGSPYIVIDGEPFWGHDRLGQVEKWLATGGW
jgi:2-hydroxychromene-2-carboxylate isomerase